MKKYFNLGLVLLLLVILLIPVYGNQRYSDLPVGHWAYRNVEEMSDSGLISGYPDGTFGPDKEITYGEFIKLLYVCQTGESLIQPEECWALNYYYESGKIGLFTLADVGQNDLDKIISRGAMALMVGNTLKNYGYEVPDDIEEIFSEIYDINKSTTYVNEIAMCFKAGILNGYPDGNFLPNGSLTRAEAVTVISRIAKLIPTAKYEKSEFIGVQTVKNRGFKVTVFKVHPGFKGIKKFKYDNNTGLISVYSDGDKELSLFIDGYMADPVIFGEEEVTVDEGFNVYYFKGEKYYNEKSKLGIAFGEYIDEVYYYFE